MTLIAVIEITNYSLIVIRATLRDRLVYDS